MRTNPTAIALAPMDYRLRLAVGALLFSWILSALFIVLGWRESRANAAADPRPAIQSSSANHTDANARAFSVASLPAR